MSTYTNYSKLEVDGTISSSVQGELIGTFTTMPTASALNEGKTIYYTGATSGNYVQNTFYTCVNNSGTYTWTSASPKQVSVDSALSETSTNPVQNKVIANALKGYAKKEDISTAYKAKGSIASANLPSNPSVGDVYDLTDASSYGPVGTNVVWTGTEWDALAGITDLSGKQDKLTAGTGISIGSNNTISLATSGVTAGTTGSATNVPVITVDAYGRITSVSTSTIYPPTSAGTSGQIWVSDGSGQGVWQSKDTTPTSGSTNAITSGAVHSELAKKQNNLTFDSAPTASSSNPVTSGGVYTALQAKQNNLTFDSTPTSGSSNPVTSGGVYSAINAVQTTLSGKQDKLTFDSTPTSGSNNPVTSGGIFTAINNVSTRVSGCVNGAQYEGNTLTFTKDSGDTFSVTISRPEGGTIAVQLSNSTYQSYLAGVTVTANNGTSTFSATTDSSGYAEINVNESGTYTVSPASEYFNPSSSSCDITYKQNLNFSLEAISYDLGTLSRGSQYYVAYMSDIKTSLGANTTTYSGGKAYTSSSIGGSAYTPDGFLPRFYCRMKTSGMSYSGSSANRNAYVFNVNRTTFYNKVKGFMDSAIGGNTGTINTRGHRLKIDWVVSFRWNSISDFSDTYSFQTIDSYNATATTIYGTNGQLESYSFGAFSTKSSYTIACDSSSDTIAFSPEHIYGNITVL
jgi:hypothetical protein